MLGNKKGVSAGQLKAYFIAIQKTMCENNIESNFRQLNLVHSSRKIKISSLTYSTFKGMSRWAINKNFNNLPKRIDDFI